MCNRMTAKGSAELNKEGTDIGIVQQSCCFAVVAALAAQYCAAISQCRYVMYRLDFIHQSIVRGSLGKADIASNSFVAWDPAAQDFAAKARDYKRRCFPLTVRL